MAFSKTLISLLLVVLVLTNMVASQITEFNYVSFRPSTRGLIYQGDAFVPRSSSSLYLTKLDASGRPMAQSVGRVVYSPPLKFWDTGTQLTFQTTIKFSITSYDNNPGDGLTFFIIPVGSPIPNPSYGGSLGLFNLNTGTAPSVFAVEFDTFFTGDNTWDPRFRHIGIDINSRVSRAVSRFEDALGKTVTARIVYRPNTRTISVVARYGNRNATLIHRFDLKTILPKEVQIGISAATGGSVALHILRAWDFFAFPIPDNNHLDPKTL